MEFLSFCVIYVRCHLFAPVGASMRTKRMDLMMLKGLQLICVHFLRSRALNYYFVQLLVIGGDSAGKAQDH